MDLPSNISKESKTKILELFQTMDDSPGKESDTLAMNWLKQHANFSGFVDGKWLPDVKELKSYKISCCLTGRYFADVTPPSPDVLDHTAKNSRKGLEVWAALSANQRAQNLRRIAQIIEKNAELVAQIECLSSTKPLHRTKSVDVPNLVQSFHYYCSWAYKRDDYSGFKEAGVVCIVSEKNNNPMLSMSLRIGSVIAGGNVVLLLVDKKSCFTALLLAELCHLSGLPSGVLNVLPIEMTDFKTLPAVDKLIINGCRLKANKLIKMAAVQGIPCEVFIPSKPVIIVYENADLHSACDGILETLFFNDIANEESCCRVYVQESIQKKFYSLLELKFKSISVGTNLTKTDMTCAFPKTLLEQLELTVNEAKEMQFKIIEGPNPVLAENVNASSLNYKPILIFNVPTTSKLFEKIVGPVVITTPFRTVKESIAMVNLNKNVSQVSIWNERLTVGLEVAYKLKVQTVWLNSQNLFDASVAYGSIYKQGSSVEGSSESFFNHLSICKSSEDDKNTTSWEEINLYGAEAATSDTCSNVIMTENICGHHIGGSYKKSDNKSRVVKTATKIHSYVADGSSSDIHAAVASALGVQSKWAGLSKYKKSQILLKAADTLHARKDQFISELQKLLGREKAVCSKEVEESVSVMQFLANDADKFDGQIRETEYGKVLLDCNPLGVIGIQCPDQNPLLSFVTLAISAIAYGNAVVVIPSEKYPVLALKMCEVLYSSGLLGGVVNVVNGSRAYLTRHLCLNLDVDSVWFSADGAGLIYTSCITHPKRVFNCKDIGVDINVAKRLKLQLESTVIKAIYIPVGSIFAN